jgi:hypothetical protein
VITPELRNCAWGVQKAAADVYISATDLVVSHITAWNG